MPRKPSPREGAELIRDLVQKRRHRVMPAELFQGIVDELGGPKKLAKFYADLILDGTQRVGAHVKQRVLDSILRLGIEVGRNHAPPADLSQMSAADLQNLAEELLLAAVDNASKSGTDGLQEETPGPAEGAPAGPGPAADDPATCGDPGGAERAGGP